MTFCVVCITCTQCTASMAWSKKQFQVLVLFVVLIIVLAWPIACALFNLSNPPASTSVETKDTYFLTFGIILGCWGALCFGHVYHFAVGTEHETQCKTYLIGYVTALVAIVIGALANSTYVDVASLLWAKFTKLSFVATSKILRYVTPFMIYPVILFWLKVLLYNTENMNADSRCIERRWDSNCHQSRLIAWVIKVIIMVFVLFDIADSVGIQTGDVVQITQIFSIGISWSMRDWLSGLWACFMLAFTTDIAPNRYIETATNGKLYVEHLGLLFVTCVTETDAETALANKGSISDVYPKVHIPNTELLQRGYKFHK